jgi:hypothetical protein
VKREGVGRMVGGMGKGVRGRREVGQVPQHRLWRYIAILINTYKPNSSWLCEYATDATAVRWIDTAYFAS